ncbi:hypothetical protein K438DRAFT_1755014 [Mycena galopus ATCC 62051]|nr:hypothetical protein K438DRAFT_1755014 [Mycena galopus ATCC 62051]
MQMALKKKKNLKAQDEGPLCGWNDDELESEEPVSGGDDGENSDASVTFPSSTVIKLLQEVHLHSQIPKPVKLCWAKRSTEPKTAARAFIQLPEGSTEECCRDVLYPLVAQYPLVAPLLHRIALRPPPTLLQLDGTNDCILLQHHSPPPKCSKPVPRTAEFCQGFAQVAEVKPVTGDYTDILHALILRACADYSAHIVAREAFPDVPLQITWGEETFMAAGRIAKEPHLVTDQILTIICVRGSQKCGKMVEPYRALCDPHFGFQRSTATKHIEANWWKVVALLEGAAFHYKVSIYIYSFSDIVHELAKDPKTRTGYGGNKIITAACQATTFKARDSSGVLFPSYFDPYPLPAIALDFAMLKFVIREWSSGSFIQSKFSEKDVAKRCHVHLADTEKWSKLNEDVVKNIRHNWYHRIFEMFVTESPLQLSTNIDDKAIVALCTELAGRTGDTDSESHLERHSGVIDSPCLYRSAMSDTDK